MIPVGVPTYVAALYDFASGGVAQATFSFDSPLRRMGVVEIAGTEATLAAPDSNDFTGEILIHRAEKGSRRRSSPRARIGGRGIGVVDMARAIRAGRPHSAGGASAFTCSTRCSPRSLDRDRRLRRGREAAPPPSRRSPRGGTRPRPPSRDDAPHGPDHLPRR